MSNADQYTLETPENIEVDFELAGLGSRFCAMLIDTMVLGVIVLALVLLGVILGFALPRGLGDHFRPSRVIDWLMAVVLALVMALVSGGYFIFFELLMRGQTPGKKAMRIRVIRDDGIPATVYDILVRNLLRMVDFLPFAYALGALVMFPNPLCKRLGDLAAGTIVVKEGQLDYRANADKKRPADPVAVAAANAELTAEERRVITGFLQRRAELLPEARRQLAERLAGPLHAKYAGQYRDAESYLERLAEGRHYES
jgi:uncharacterized RDD family membrane protein YckC